MKKLLMIIFCAMLVACSSGVGVDELAAKMPNNDRTFVVRIPAASNSVSNAMVVGMIKTSGTPSASNLINVLSVDNANIGIAGNSQMINKATVLYALQNAQKIGNNIVLYMMGDSESDKADLEKAANSKNIKFHYFVTTK
ncbi:hypothetical protein BKG95_08600 [Rodentibacter pneumotropicus]|uniref:Lipoprotein n=2 Tax=Rodentibacter pneumotropicus TaxID=758 RepID=A0AAW5L926_9PAST|nr:hypothetical protein [Rodentibacter pneumotropicus]OOF67100.1 hypothetical protein BKG95_08600 [Rodentibacter pneumotropicus]